MSDEGPIYESLIRAIDIATVSLPDHIPTAHVSDLDRYIADSIPFIFGKGIAELGLHLSPRDVLELLNSDAKRKIQVAQTPLGNADAPFGDLFVQPSVTSMTIGDLLLLLDSKDKNTVSYMQSQDDNLRKEFLGLPGIPTSLKLVSENSSLLGAGPDASNIWIGGPGTVSRLHSDNYDNIYLQLSGHKTIYLIPPLHVFGVHEQFLKPATYTKKGQDGDWSLTMDEGHSVLFPTMNPAEPETWVPETKFCRMYKIVLGPGDALFIPALWYHQVETCSCCTPNVSVNYWYAPPEARPLWNSWSFMRSMCLHTRGYTDKDYFE